MAANSLKFFIDNNLSRQLAAGMYAFGEDVMHLRDKFAEDTDDEEWLEFIGSKGIVLITRDLAIRRKPAELAALKQHKVRAFFLGGKNLDRCSLIQQLVRNWPRIKVIANRKKAPFAFRVPPRGRKFDSIPL